MTAEERKHRIEAYLQRVEFALLEELSQHVEAISFGLFRGGI